MSALWAGLSPDTASGLCPTCLLENVLNEPESPPAEPAEVDGKVLATAGLVAAPSVPAVDRFGDYRLEGDRARGMGIIYRAHQLSLNRDVA
ncbi:MAG: hypothetical protein M5U12_12705 [Verrucomicrobia bacterium]|nr:hypothetical protein [Verrucomicrobiota bacterium]